jgi:hypothetical protein
MVDTARICINKEVAVSKIRMVVCEYNFPVTVVMWYYHPTVLYQGSYTFCLDV